MPELIKHESVLKMMQRNQPNSHVRYTRLPDEEGDVPDIVKLPRELVEALGTPEEITIAVRAGDWLNVPVTSEGQEHRSD